MDSLHTLVTRNVEFAHDGFTPGLRMMPSLRTIVIGCVDGRVDPADVFDLAAGEAVVIRNVGGRVTPDVRLQLSLLRDVTRAVGGDVAAGWQIIVLHHTDCGITRIDGTPDLAGFLDVDSLEGCHVSDPVAAVALDLDALRADSRISAEVQLSGLVYDVPTGLVTPV